MDTMKIRGGLKKIGVVALLTVAIGVVAAAPSQARDGGVHGFSGAHRGAVEPPHRAFEVHRGFDRDHHVRGFAGFGYWGAYPYAWDYPPAYAYSDPQTYYYYCTSAGAYYPDVPSCPEAWVPVPAQ